MMKEPQDYLQDITTMRTLMERSTRFLSLSGISGVLIGVYALLGVTTARYYLGFQPLDLLDQGGDLFLVEAHQMKLVLLAIVILVLSLGTAFILSKQKAAKKGEQLWNITARSMLVHLSTPLMVGGILMLIFFSKGWLGFLAPLSQLFYGLALVSVSKFTFSEMRGMGWVQLLLGLLATALPAYSLLCWALGFGVSHIAYGIYLHYKYER